jgi:Sulfatase
MRRELGRQFLHLLVLWTFAVAEPLFDLLGRTPEFFVVRGSKPVDIVVFALVVALVPPALLVGLEALVALASAAAERALHLTLVATLAAVVAVQLVRKESHATLLVFAVSAGLGVAFAAVYARARGVRMFVTVLAPVPLLFLVLFLARSPIAKLEGTAKALSIPQPPRDPPVVLLILDEFPVTSLMDARHRIDAVRFPNFGRLARASTWYRDATSVHEHTTEAVPAIMTGQNPRQGTLPLAKDHPDSVFTLLAKRYREDVFESVTQVCPEKICARRTESFSSRMRSLADDLQVVYGHLVLPKPLEDKLPSVSNTWQDFNRQSHGAAGAAGQNPLIVSNTKQIDVEVGRMMWRDQRSVFDHWVDGIRTGRRPTLYVLHALMPHYPWRYLPNGKQYGSSLGIDGLGVDVWQDDPWLVEQGWQRHLFQVGFTDRLLGGLMTQLRRERIWDRALVIVVADHGVSFIPGEHRRSVDRANLPDIASIPLFVKYPGERRGRVSDKNAETVDIVPTIADVLGISLPYHADGISLRSPRTHPGKVEVREREGGEIVAPAASVRTGKYATLTRQLALFGSGAWRKVYDVGPHRELLGRAVSSLRSVAGSATVSIDGESLFGAVDLRSALSPGHVTGRISGAKSRLDLAIAVDGRIAAVTHTFEVDGETHFGAFAPDAAFHQGANSVRVYAVRGRTLERLRGGVGAESSYALAGTTLRGPTGAPIRIVPGALVGRVEDWYFESGTVRFGGWAGDPVAKAIPDAVVVFGGGRFLYAGTTTVGRTGMFKLRPDGSLIKSGFVFELPRSLVGDGPGSPPLRFFAVRGNRATELPLPKGFPWAPAS